MINRAAGEVVMMHRLSVDHLEPGPYQKMTDAPSLLEEYLETRCDHATGVWPAPASAEGRPWFALTFDDGYRDNLYEALPILERYNVPAIVFVTVGFVARELEPYSAFIARSLAERAVVRINGKPYPLTTYQEREAAERQLYRSMDRGGREARRRAFRFFLSENDLETPTIRPDVYLNWDELRKLSAHPLITIGAHSWTHPRLSRIPPWELYRELAGARKRLQQELGKAVSTVAYPHGAANSLVEWAARRAGYDWGFTTQPRRVPAGTALNRMSVPRLELSQLLNPTKG